MSNISQDLYVLKYLQCYQFFIQLRYKVLTLLLFNTDVTDQDVYDTKYD